MIFRKSIYAAVVAAAIAAWFHAAAAQEVGIIQVQNLRMRSGPGTDYRIVSHLPREARVSVVERRNGWMKIEHNGMQGFILDREKYVKITVMDINPPSQASKPLKPPGQDAETIGKKLQQAQSQLATISRKENAVLDEFNAADEALSRIRRQVTAAKSELAQVQAKIEDVQKEASALEKEIAAGERYASKRLVALYKLNWVGKIQLLATADSFFDFVNRKDALEKILSRDEMLLDELNQNKFALERLLTRLNTQKSEKRALEDTLKSRIAKLNTRQKQRKSLLQTIRGKKSLELAAITSLKQAALELDAAIERIDPVEPQAMAARTTGVRDKPFKSYKGLLSWPVKGKIITFFGPYRDKRFEVTNFASGINIQAERGEPVRSVLSGHVIFANWFKGFGNMMIIDHGSHYYTVYAHLEEVFKVKGDRVDQGEVIATVGDSGSMKGPALHFEVRHHGRPVDPLEWIQKG